MARQPPARRPPFSRVPCSLPSMFSRVSNSSFKSSYLRLLHMIVICGGNEVEMDIEKIMTQSFEMDMGSSESSVKKTELDKYMGEDREPNDPKFDILNWWKVQQCRYPVLAKMAKDILAIPVSTVASESAFSTGGRVLDTFQTSLTPRMVEAWFVHKTGLELLVVLQYSLMTRFVK